MALKKGHKWAIYMLMAKHDSTPEGKSQFRTRVDELVAGGKTPHEALTTASREHVNPAIADGDVGPLNSFSSKDLRAALDINGYDPSLGPCPSAGDQDGFVGALDNIA